MSTPQVKIAVIGGSTILRARSIMIPINGDLLIYVDNPEAVELQDLGTVVEVAVYTSTLPYVRMDDVEFP
jgi:hypothetical protein